MTDIALPVLYALFVWWFSTGAIMYLGGLPAATFRWTIPAATGVLALAFHALYASSADASVGGAYVAFTAALLVFGWLELTFYTGFIAGPKKTPAPAACSTWRRFQLGLQATLYHELALAAAAAVVVTLTWGGANQVGTWTFLALWWMHQSAKLNLFLGVPNLNEHFLPDRMQYLASFFQRRPMNLLFPASVTISTVVTAFIVYAMLQSAATEFDRACLTFLATLMALAVLEHWLLVLPLPAAALWNWSLISRQVKPEPELAQLPTIIGRRS